ncbi:hypothetical protein QBC35DRAFT_141145 [Podospora australis]|uniref:BHLH domain-containing protein n=1 Tax=Podospora australis TaxID=1536484 RepID=A0AAN6WWU2_9PEZI|nr:hypothetical protein QBC35DRAFT_141145 [Podospora australis]
MESSTTTTRFMSRGLDADTDETILYPLTPTYDYLDPIGFGAHTVSWCLPDASFPVSALLERPPCEPFCEPSSDYFFLPRDSLSGLEHPGLGSNWPAPPHGFTFEVPYPTPLDTMGSDSSAWTGEVGADKGDQVRVPGGKDSSSSSPMEVDSSVKRSSSEESPPPASLPSTLTTGAPKTAAARPKSRVAKHNIQLRTASRKSPKASPPSARSPISPAESAHNQSASDPEDDLTPEERRARRNHNRVEKQYRNRLNNQFERLLAVLPLDQCKGGHVVHDGNGYSSDEKRMSKAEVLDLATRRIKALEVDRERLQKEREELMRNIDVMAGAIKAGQKP